MNNPYSAQPLFIPDGPDQIEKCPTIEDVLEDLPRAERPSFRITLRNDNFVAKWKGGSLRIENVSSLPKGLAIEL